MDLATQSNVVDEVVAITVGGARTAVVACGSGRVFMGATEMPRIDVTLCCIGIPPEDVHLTTQINTITIRGLEVVGKLLGSMEETSAAVKLVGQSKMKVC